jgi:hypothetical protein
MGLAYFQSFEFVVISARDKRGADVVSHCTPTSIPTTAPKYPKNNSFQVRTLNS